MSKHLFTSVFVLVATLLSAGEPPKEITLPAPDKAGGKPLMQVITERQTQRNFKSDALPAQEISNLFYAAYGKSRSNGKLTVPTAMNMQNLTLYAAFPEGYYKYDPNTHKLLFVKAEDLRGKTFMRPEMPLSAPLVIIYTADVSKGRDEVNTRLFSHAHAGSAYQNVYLYCASKGLATVICAGFDRAALTKDMNLPEKQEVLYAQIVGIPAKKENTAK